MAGEQNIDELLKRLASVKSLPAPSQPFRTAEAAAGAQVRDAAGRAFASTPRLGDAIQGIQQGGSAQTGATGAFARAVGSPVGKAVLGGLNLIDVPRRIVLSGVKEAADFLDNDPNTRASFSDFRTQRKDPTFGYGRIAPASGWGGRLIGFVGDVAFDPVTYLTLGATVPLKAVAMGSRAATAAGLTLRAGAKVGAESASLRAALGTKNVAGREGRFALANLVKQYGGNAQEVSAVASRGKSAVPEDIAKVLGLQRNGLYMFGSRVRVPFSGPIGNALEQGIIKTRLGITNTNVGRKLQYLYTPRGASARLGDLKTIRADMASGRTSPETVDLIMTQLSGAENARRFGAKVGADTGRAANAAAITTEVKQYDDSLASLIESGSDEFLSTPQRTAKATVQKFFSDAADVIDGMMGQIEPGWTLPRVPNYVPHVLDDKARRWMEANLDNRWVQRLESYMTSDVMDLRNNMAGRYLRAGVDFLDSGKILQTGSIDEINALFKEVTGQNFNLFETSITRIMGKYVDTVRSAAEVSSLLGDLKSNDFIRLLRTQGEIDPEYVGALRGMVADKFDEAGRLQERLRTVASDIAERVQRDFGRDSRSGIASRLAGQVGDLRDEIRSATKVADLGAEAQPVLDDLVKQMDDLIAKQKIETDGLGALFEEQSVVYDSMKLSYDKNVEIVADLSRKIASLRDEAADSAESLKAFQQSFDAATAAFKEAEETAAFYRQFGDDIAPVLQDVYNQMRDAATDGDLENVVYLGDEAWKREGNEKIRGVMEVLMKPFSNDLYPSSIALGEDWARTSFNAANESGVLLRSLPDIGGKGTKAKRGSFAAQGSRRQLTMDDARNIIARSSMVGDNPEDVADSFYFLTARELRAAYDAAGGGEAGTAAQNRVARELGEGITSRAQLWQEAEAAVERVVRSRESLQVVGSRRIQMGGEYQTSSLDTIENLRAELSKARSIGNVEVSNRLTSLGALVDSLGKEPTQENLILFVRLADETLNAMRSQKASLAVDNAEFVALDSFLERISKDVQSGEFAKPVPALDEFGLPSKTKTISAAQKAKQYFDSISNVAELEFTNQDLVALKSRQLAKLEKQNAKALAIDKRFNDGATALGDAVVDSGMKLSNYLILHQARVSIDAIKKLSPPGLQIGEDMWNYARAGAARQQMQTVIDFGNTRRAAEKIMRRIQSDVYARNLQPKERALALRDAMESLDADDYRAIADTVGNLNLAVQGEIAGRRITSYRRNNPKYVAIRDEILDIVKPGWKQVDSSLELSVTAQGRAAARASLPYTFEGDVRNLRGMTSDVERAVLAAEEQGLDISEMNRAQNDLLRAKDYSPIGKPSVRSGGGWSSQAELVARQNSEANEARRLIDTTPKKLVGYVQDLKKQGRIDEEQSVFLLERIKQAELSVQAERKTYLSGIDEDILAQEKRELGRAARGAKQQENEAFGLSGAYRRAIAIDREGGTRNGRHLEEFFTYLFGDGKVRVGSATYKAPSRVDDTGVELAQKKAAQRVFKDARAAKALRAKEGMDSVQNELQFWREVGDPNTGAYVDSTVAESLVLRKADARKTVSDLKQILKGMQSERTSVVEKKIEDLQSRLRIRYSESAENRLEELQETLRGLRASEDITRIDIAQTADGLDTAGGIRQRIATVQKKIADIDKQLSEMEQSAGRVVQTGVASDNTMRTIRVSESHFGKLASRTERRLDALKALAIDPAATKEMTNLGVGVGADARDQTGLIGRFGYYQYLQSNLNELEAQVAVVQQAEKTLGKLEGKASRASAAKQQALRDAQAIRENPALQARVNQAIDGSGELKYPRKSDFLNDTLLGQKLVDNPRAGETIIIDGEAVKAPKKVPSVYIPDSVASLINRARTARLEMEKIENSVQFTRALQRQEENNFLKAMASLNFDATALEFPNAVYDTNMQGLLKRFASTSNDNLDASSVQVFDVKERVFADVAEKLLDVGQKKFEVGIAGFNRITMTPTQRVASRQAVSDFVRARSGVRFSYSVVAEKIPDGRQQIFYVDEKTGYKFTLGEDAASYGVLSTTPGNYPKVEFGEPLYLRDPNSSQRADFLELSSGQSNVVVYELKGRVKPSLSKEAADLSFFNPETSIAVFGSGTGTGGRIYRLPELGITTKPSNALSPEVVFDPAQGRGLTKENFEALFIEPNIAPFGPKAKKARAQINEAVRMRDDMVEMYNQHRAKARAATTERSRRNYQSLAASLQEDIVEQDAVIVGLQARLDASRPATRMASVEMALNVKEYFKNPTVRAQLGMPVKREMLPGIDPATKQQRFRYVDVSDKDAIDAFKKYVGALESGQLPRVGDDVDIPSAVVPDSVRDARKTYLKKEWKNSEEGALIRKHNEHKTVAGAVAKELAVIRNGGVAAELDASIQSARNALSKAQIDLGIKQGNLRKALRKGSPRVSVRVREDVAAVARETIASRRALIDSVASKEFIASIPEEFRAAVRSEALGGGDETLSRQVWSEAEDLAAEDVGSAFAALRVREAAESVIQREIDSLVKEEARINKALAGMIKTRVYGESVDRATSAVLPPEFKELRLRLNGNIKYGVKGLKTEIAQKKKLLADIATQRQNIEAKIIQQRTAVDLGFAANLNKQDAESRLTLVRDALQDMKELRGRARKPSGKKDSTDWMAEFDDFAKEVDELLSRVSAMPDGVQTDRLSAMITAYTEGKANWLRTLGLAGEAEREIPAMLAMGPQVYSKVLDDGWVQLTGSGSLSNFKNLQMRPEVAEVISNMNRLRDGAMVAELNRWIGPYTKFFKAWALATPGYHSRNALTNGFMMFAAGGRPKFLYEGMMEYNALHKALKENIPFEQYAATLPTGRRQIVTDAYDAMLGSGVGQTSEIAFDTSNALTNNPWTRGNRRVGVWTESHSRFMLSYDGLRQGLDVNGATARTRKFLFDYEDLSTLDVKMRSVIPFWMWTSRIMPLTIQNIYMNPRPYQFYNNLRRNLEDREKTEGLPQYMRDAGAFALPGTDFAAMPDLGFTRTQADIKQLTDPTRFAANINPALRLPAELLAGKSFFRNREFDDTPKQVDGPVGTLASLLGSPLGMGGEVGGKRFVDEKLLYGITNALPQLNQVERFIPSQEYYQQRGSTNPLLGYLGAPVRQVTPQMRTSEQRRILAEIQKLLAAQPKVTPDE